MSKTKKQTIPLAQAVVAWEDSDEIGVVGRVGVFSHPTNGTLPKWAQNTDGACWTVWGRKAKEQRLIWLFSIMHQIISTKACKYWDVHSALCVIPEYVEALTVNHNGIEFE